MFRWLILFAALPLFGADFRIDLQALSNQGLVVKEVSPGLTGTQAEWLKGNKDRRLVVSGPADSEWREYTFTFLAKKGGKVQINLMSSNKKDQVSFRNLKLSGKSLSEDGPFTVTHDDRKLLEITCKKGEPATLTFQARYYLL